MDFGISSLKLAYFRLWSLSMRVLVALLVVPSNKLKLQFPKSGDYNRLKNCSGRTQIYDI